MNSNTFRAALADAANHNRILGHLFDPGMVKVAAEVDAYGYWDDVYKRLDRGFLTYDDVTQIMWDELIDVLPLGREEILHRAKMLA